MSSNNVENGATVVRRAIDEWMLKDSEGNTYPITGTVIVGREDSCDVTIHSNEVSRQHARIAVQGDHLLVQDLNSTNGTLINGSKVSSAPARAGDKITFDTNVFEVIGPEPVNNATQVRAVVEPSPVEPQSPEPVAKATQAVAAAQTESHTQFISTQAVAEIENNREHNSNWRQSTITEAGTRLMSTERPCLVGVSAPYRGKKFVLSLSGASIGRLESNDICLVEPSISSKHAEIRDKNGSWRVNDCGSSNGTFVNGERIQSSPLEPEDKIHFGHVEMLYLIDDGSNYEERITKAESEIIRQGKKSLPAWAYALVSF